MRPPGKHTKHKNKLSPQQIAEIKELLMDERGIKQDWIARKYNVRQSTISFHKKQLELKAKEDEKQK